MSDLKKNVRPILELFSTQIHHRNLLSVLANWREMLARGMHNFGRKEDLGEGMEFNLLIHTDLNAKPNKTGSKVILDPVIDIVGVVTNKKYAHAKFQYLKNEMLIARARAKWDYSSDRGFRNVKLDQKVTVRVPPAIDPDWAKHPEQYVNQVAKQCFSWLVLNRMTEGR